MTPLRSMLQVRESGRPCNTGRNTEGYDMVNRRELRTGENCEQARIENRRMVIKPARLLKFGMVGEEGLEPPTSSV